MNSHEDWIDALEAWLTLTIGEGRETCYDLCSNVIYDVLRAGQTGER